MPELGALAVKVRSKNAGPFWLTIDVFCGTTEAYETIRKSLTGRAVAERLGVEEQLLKRFEVPDLNVLKFSIPRPAVQGTPFDRDMHGAALAAQLAEMEVG